MSHTPSPYWGRDQAAFLADLRDALVTVAFVDGKGLKGALVGTDPYNVFVQVKLNGTLTEVMIPKHAIRYIHGMEALEP